ncbi:MAG: sulfatase-like hydrolase/transferase, partial [Akkermansia sp.]
PFYPRPDWNTMPEDDKKLEIRRMEIYAAMIAYADHCLGRVIEELKASGRYDNTIIIVMADNGANPHPSDSYGPISGVTLNNSFENLGNADSFISLGCHWAESCNTPFTSAKTMHGAGGITCPLIIKGLGGKQGSIDRESLVHVTDILPTLLDKTTIQRPDSYKGTELAPLYGKSLLPSLASGKPARDANEAICFEMVGGRAIIKGDWKLFTLTEDDKDWQLYNMRHDLAEQDNLATTEPAKFQELLQEWQAYAKKVGYIKGDGKIRGTLHRLGPEEFYKYDPAKILTDSKDKQ